MNDRSDQWEAELADSGVCGLIEVQMWEHRAAAQAGHFKEDMYTEVFDKIKADPDGDQTDEKEISYERKGNRMVGSDGAGRRAR